MKVLKLIYKNRLIKWVVIPITLIFFWFITTILFNPYAPFTTIIYKHSSSHFSEYHQGMLLKGQQIKGVFTGEENNLGIIGIKIRGGVSVNADDQESLQFELKERKGSSLLYSNTYNVGQIRENEYLIFGFPKIIDSKGKDYEFTLTSLNGDLKNSLDLHKEEDFFISKYVYSARSLKSVRALSMFLEARMRMLFLNIEALLVSSIYFLPFLFYITLIGFSKTFKSKLGSLTLSLIVLSIIFIPDIYTGIVLGLLGLWIIAVIKDKVTYQYTLGAVIFFYVLSGIFAAFTRIPEVDSSSLWGYLLLVVGVVQLIIQERRIDVKKNLKSLLSKFFTKKNTPKDKEIIYVIQEDAKPLLPFIKNKFISRLSIHVLFLLFCIIVLIPVLIDPHVAHANDLNGTDLYQIYFRTVIRTSHEFPQWNPVMQQGIPLVADPMYSMYNPVMSIPIFIAPSYDVAIKMIYIISLFLSCETMYLLTKEITKSSRVSFFIALTFATAGYAGARILAGHIESFVPYCVIPFLLFSLYKVTTQKNMLWSGICALTFTYIMFAGSIYFLLYGLYCLAGLFIYGLFKEKKASMYLIVTFVLLLLFSAIKVFPALEVQSSLGKTREPFLGSQTLISMIRYLFIPFDVPFNLFHLTEFLTPAWAELEKIAFIGVFPFFGLAWLLGHYREIKIPQKSFLTIIFITCLLILMPAWKLNPLHWMVTLVGTLQFFRVPSRAFAFLIVVILVLFGLFARLLIFNKKTARFVFPMLIANLLLTTLFFETLLIKPSLVAYTVYPANYSLYNTIFSWIEKHNTNNTSTLVEIWPNEVPEDVAFYHNQRLLNTNYGFVLKNSPAANFASVQRPSPFAYAYNYTDIQPGYFISPHNQVEDIPVYAKKVYENDDTSVYQLPNGRPLGIVKASGGETHPVAVLSGVDSFTITTNAENNEILSLAQMNYPGWSVAIDGRHKTLENGRFLEVKTIKGNHTYLFYFSSKTFIAGLFVTLISLLSWSLYVIFPFLRKHIL